MIMLHPIMPFITEELWATTGTRAKPLVHTDWPTYGAELIDAEAMREMNWVTSADRRHPLGPRPNACACGPEGRPAA